LTTAGRSRFTPIEPQSLPEPPHALGLPFLLSGILGWGDNVPCCQSQRHIGGWRDGEGSGRVYEWKNED